MSVVLLGFKEVDDAFKKIKTELVRNKSNINLKRAQAYTKYTKGMLGSGKLGLKKNTPATRIIQKVSHPPLSWKHEMVRQIESKKLPLGAAGSGFFASNQKKPGPRHLPFKSRNPLTWTQIANIQHTGFRIPLQGDKGKRVRNFLAFHGIYMKKTKTHIIVAPRPFLDNALVRFSKSGRDDAVINKFTQKLWAKL